MVLAIPPKPVPKALRLHEAAARIVEFEPFLNINEVRKRLSELVASGDLPAQSEIEDPGNDLAWSFGWRRAGLLGARLRKLCTCGWKKVRQSSGNPTRYLCP